MLFVFYSFAKCLWEVQRMFPQGVVHRDWSSARLGRAETRPPAGAWPRGRGTYRVLHPEVPDGGRARPGDDSGRDLSDHVLQCHHHHQYDQWCRHYPVPGGFYRRSRVHNDGADLLDEMTVIQTIQTDNIGLEKYRRRKDLKSETLTPLSLPLIPFTFSLTSDSILFGGEPFFLLNT